MTTPQVNLHTNSPQTFTVNMADIAESPTHYSIPVVFTKEGVHNGSLKPYPDFRNKAQDLIGKPVVIQHPKNGDQPRAVDPTRDLVSGEVESCQARDQDKALHGRIKLDKQKTPQWFIDELKAGRLRGGSLGYFRTVQPIGGLHNGTPYQEIESITGWDHYAIGLPDGAAKISDGCGLRFNSQQPTNDDDEVPTMGKIKKYFAELLKKTKPNEEEDETKKEDQKLSEEEKKRLEKLEKQLETLTQEREANKKLQEELQTKLAEAEKQLKTYTEREAKQESEKREALIKELLEGTDLKAEVYKDFSSTQLETVKAQITAQQKIQQGTKNPLYQQQQQPTTSTSTTPVALADRVAQKPPIAQPAAAAENGLTIGNSLFGKKMGET